MDLDANHKFLEDPVIYDDKIKQDLPKLLLETNNQTMTKL